MRTLKAALVVALIAIASLFQLIAFVSPTYAQSTRAQINDQIQNKTANEGQGSISNFTLASLFQLIASSSANLVEVNTFTPPSPAWGTDYGVNNGFVSNINNFPLNAIFTNGKAGSTPISSAITGALLVDASDTSLFLNNGVSGYVASLSGNPTVGVFGGCVQLSGAYLSSCWGTNTVVDNAPVIAPFTGTGFDFALMYGSEFDVNVTKKAGGARPAGTVRGMSIFSGSEILPIGGAYGVEIGPYELTGTEGWTAALVIDDGPSTYGIELGKSARSGNGLGSQSIAFNSITSGGVAQQDSMLADQNADLVINMPTNSIFAVQNNLVNTLAVSATLGVQFMPQVAVQAGGTQNNCLQFSATANFGICWGSGAPTLSAAKGTLYIRSDGSSTSNRLYVNTTGSTTWTNFGSAS